MDPSLPSSPPSPFSMFCDSLSPLVSLDTPPVSPETNLNFDPDAGTREGETSYGKADSVDYGGLSLSFASHPNNVICHLSEVLSKEKETYFITPELAIILNVENKKVLDAIHNLQKKLKKEGKAQLISKKLSEEEKKQYREIYHFSEQNLGSMRKYKWPS